MLLFLKLVRRTLISALHVWLDSYPEDFRDPPNHPALCQLLNFCEDHLPATELEAKVRHRLHRYSQEANCEPILAPPAAFAMRTMPVAEYSRLYKLPDVPVRHFAEQLTRMDVVGFVLLCKNWKCINLLLLLISKLISFILESLNVEQCTFIILSVRLYLPNWRVP